MHVLVVECPQRTLLSIEKLVAQVDSNSRSLQLTEAGLKRQHPSECKLAARSDRHAPQRMNCQQLRKLLADRNSTVLANAIFVCESEGIHVEIVEHLERQDRPVSIVVIRDLANRQVFDWIPVNLPGTRLPGLNSKQLKSLLEFEMALISANVAPAQGLIRTSEPPISPNSLTSPSSEVENELTRDYFPKLHHSSETQPQTQADCKNVSWQETLLDELQPPLSVVREYTSLLKEELLGKLLESQHECLQVVSERIDELGVLVEDSLEQERRAAGVNQIRRSHFDVNKLVVQSLGRLDRRAKRSGIHFDYRGLNEPSLSFGDRWQFQRALYYVLLDALNCYRATSTHILAKPKKICTSGTLKRIRIELATPTTTASDITLRIELPLSTPEQEHARNTCNSLQQELPRYNRIQAIFERNFGSVEIENEHTSDGSAPRRIIRLDFPAESISSMIPKYLNKVTAFKTFASKTRPDTASFPLSAIGFGLATQKAFATEIADEFVQSLQSENGLVFRVTNTDWVWLENLSSKQRDQLIQRLGTRWQAFQAEMNLEQDVALEAKSIATFELPEEAVGLLEFMDEFIHGPLKVSGLAANTLGENRSRKLLLADGDIGFSAGLMQQLENYGYEVITALNAEGLVDRATTTSPDAILVNSEMTLANGNPAWKSLRQFAESAQTPILMLADDLRKQHCHLELGLAGILGRSLNTKPLQRKLEEILSST